ncbi:MULTISPECIES: mechanosensitive ion channel protein [Acaryochloris]|uniref:Mechanosensitive ion channel n=1 Tax=Acaryochloris marina (strain MBIC 11017) TaxID=329726 RepID=B0CFT8_ACAM1|nr:MULTISPECIES: mechanosensitive ion channel protein [Acaryochloris]ABW28242.1 mechanosensitive ion channel [Acaryochloris marina MBIC11017]KAI9134964.1 mechanosensitive ion channel protein [Acaryochloris sp. CCMEE 5410]BDM77275.1 hypothetical protein AM10699_01490 [Acaryochloris marina MBIC10699]
MLILESSEIEHCSLYHNIDGNQKKLAGASYQDRLYVRQSNFSKNQRQEALEYCRTAFLESKGNSSVLLVEDETEFTAWVEDKQASLAPEKTIDRITLINLEKLVAKMRTVGGIKIKNRVYRLKEYPYCFIGSEAVRWLMHNVKLSREEAIGLGQRLMDDKWIHHVSDSHQFKDEELFYRFYWDED